MLRHTALAAAVLMLLALLNGCRPGPAAGPNAPPAPTPSVRLTVFAGAASKPALDELARLYETRQIAKVDVTFGGSGSVLTQFSQEQYGDLYIPGSDDFMDTAEAKDTVLKDTRQALVYLVPVINVPAGNPKGVKGLADLARDDVRVVIGEPESVCLGAIARATLQAEGLWDKVSPHVASYATSCENVLQALLLGEADAVIGWDVFARQQSDQVESIPLPDKYSRPRNIPAAVIKWSPQPEAAQAFIAFLASAEAQAIWQRHGYTVEAPH
jgi:molybdate transport system substrate-binding protein